MKVTISVGGKYHAFHLARQLEKRGYLDKIFTSYPWFGVKESGIPRQRVECLILKEVLERGLSKIPYLSNKIEIPYYMANLFDKQVAHRINSCDIFVGWSGFSLYTLRRIRKLCQAKVIIERGSTHIENQNSVFLDEQERLGTKLALPCPGIIEKELEEYQEADYIVLPSTLAKETFLAKGFSEKKLIQVPLGVDIKTFKPIPKDDNIFRIILVGISLRKGVHYVLEAIDELKIRDLEVWLIGRVSDEIKPFLKKYSGNFRYLGAIPHKELYKYYSQGSLFIFFSLEDGFGLVLLEAMACGLAVICSDQTGAKDIVRDGIDGFIVGIRDVEMLKEKILYLYKNSDICQNMGRSALERVRKNFTWNNYGERIVKTYLNVLK